MYLKSIIQALSLIVLLLITTEGSAQKADIQYFDIEDGLSGNFTNRICQGSEGFMWVINDYKLHRFDGREFIRFSVPKDAQGDYEERLIEVLPYQDSLLLIISEFQVFIMNPRENSWVPIPFPIKLDKKDIHFFTIGDLKRGEFFIAADHIRNTFELWQFKNGVFSSTSFKGVLLQAIESYFFLDYNGHLLLLDGQQVFQYEIREPQKKEIDLPLDCPACRIVGIHTTEQGSVYRMLRAKDGAVKVYSRELNNEVERLHPVSRFLTEQAIKDQYYYALRETGEGDLWLIGQDRSLVFYNSVQDSLYSYTGQIKELIPNVNALLDFKIDNTGTVWITSSLGLLKITQQSSSFDQYFSEARSECGGNCSVRGIAEDDQGIIYASMYGGLASLDPLTKQELHLFSPQNTTIAPWGLYADSFGVWMNNMNLLDPYAKEVRAIPGGIGKGLEAGLFTKDASGRLWCMVEDELFYLQKEGAQLAWVKELELPNKRSYTTEAIHAGETSQKIWISNKGKLLQYSPDSQTQVWYSKADWGLPISRILVIEEDRKGNLWLGTDVGLVYFDPTSGSVRNYTVEDGLPNNFISGLLTEGDSILWLSTNIGLSRFNLLDESSINFFEEDGLTHNEFNRLSFFKARDGRLFFGGLKGVNAFHPQELMANYRRRNEAAKVILSSFEYIDEKKDTTFLNYNFATQPEVELRFRHRSFTFEYVLTDYRNPEEIYYSYQMEGYEDTWSTPSPFNFTRFSSLPAGEYTFRVKARDSHGIWHPNHLSVQVTVYPPWWRTTWAYIGYGLLFLVAGYFTYFFMRRRLILQNRLHMQSKEAQRLKELDTFKSRLYTNLTHEFRTPLTVILGMAEQIQGDPKKYASKGSQLIQRSGQNLLRLINQLLDLSKLENDSFELQLQQSDIVPFLRYITESFQTYANSKNLSLRFNNKLESLVMDFDQDQVQQVLTNLISNALKFTPADGDVKVRLSEVEQNLILEVQDTGIGIAEEDLPFIFDRFYQSDQSHTREGEGTGIGLAHTKELVKLMEGEIKVKSTLGEGTQFLVSLPIRRTAPEKIIETPYQQEISMVGTGIDSSLSLSNEGTALRQEIPQLLIIEDNRDIIEYLKTCFTGLYDIQIAYNGRIGVEKAIELIPDLIISDVMMPEKDGFEVCDILKNDERTSHIPFILLTAKSDTHSKITGLQRGADAYLTKPFNKEELFVRLTMLIEKQKRLLTYLSSQQLEKSTPAATTVEAIKVENRFLDKVQKIVEAHYQDEHFSLPQLCQKIGMSRSQLFRKMKALINTSPSNYIRDYRLNQAKILLETTDLTVSEVAWKVGFKSLAHFSKTFQDTFGHAPSATIK